jgi:hypothetical protein
MRKLQNHSKKQERLTLVQPWFQPDLMIENGLFFQKLPCGQAVRRVGVPPDGHFHGLKKA